MFVKKSLFFCALLILSLNLCAQQVDEILEKYVDSIGGRKNWDRIKTMTIHGTYDYGGMEFTFASFAKAPDRYKVVVTQDTKYFAQGFNGKTGWKIDVFNAEKTPTILTGKAARAMANEADVELEGPLIGYPAKGHQAVLAGVDTIGQEVCFKIKLTLRNGETEFYYFDARTSGLVMKEAVAKNPEMQGDWLTTFYSDYREVDDVKMPFNIVRKLNDQVILTTIISSVVLDEAIDDMEFEP